MRDLENVLNSLSRYSKDPSYKPGRLHKVSFSEEMSYAAYQHIYSEAGSMTAGTDGRITDGMSIDRIKQLVDSLKNETYQPAPSRRAYIPKKNGKKRSPGIPSFNDKLVQEVVRMILEAIYEGSSEHTSHGFRPGHNYRTALISMQESFSTVKWFIEGGIKGFYDNINHNVLISILQEHTADERFLRLIRKILNAGRAEDWVSHRTHGGTPRSDIVSPTLANIYPDKLDKYIREYINRFNKGEMWKGGAQYKLHEQRRYRLIKKPQNKKNEKAREQMTTEIKRLREERNKLPTRNKMDSSVRRTRYVWHADDFLIGIIDNLEDYKTVKEDIENYLREALKLELSDEKTLITNAQKLVKSFRFDIFIYRSNDLRKDKDGRMVRAFGHVSALYLNFETI